jgi:hypothetical protein
VPLAVFGDLLSRSCSAAPASMRLIKQTWYDQHAVSLSLVCRTSGERESVARQLDMALLHVTRNVCAGLLQTYQISVPDPDVTVRSVNERR